MLIPSPRFSISGNPVGIKAQVAAGGAVIATLDDIAGVAPVAWSIDATDDQHAPSDYSIVVSGNVGQTATLTAGGVGTAGSLRCQVAGGTDPRTGSWSPAMEFAVKWFVPTAAGLEVMVAGETAPTNLLGSPTHGAVAELNQSIRAQKQLAQTAERVLCAATQSTSETAGWTVIGSDQIDSADFAGAAATWVAILNTTNAAAAAQARLYNRTDDVVVATLSSASLDSEVKSGAVTLAAGAKLYEAQLKLAAIGAPERAVCKLSKLHFS